MVKLFDSELMIMNLLWKEGGKSAADIARALNAQTGWNRNTTYTVLKKLIAKGAVVRTEPGFICHAAIQKTEIQQQETNTLIKKLFDGSSYSFLASFFSNQHLSDEELQKLQAMIDKME